MSTVTAALASAIIGDADATDEVASATALALHGLLDAGGASPVPGDPLPPLWHWLAFRPMDVAQAALGPDGHRQTHVTDEHGNPLRRMWASGRLHFNGALTVGAPLRRHSEIESVERKTGRSGSLMFVRVGHTISGDHGSVHETQQLVYRPASNNSASAPNTNPRPPGSDTNICDANDFDTNNWVWQRALIPDPTLLFRFSALTYNAHRIHYDRPYATNAEGYPGLVVHGPLQAILLAELCRQHAPHDALASFEFRGVAPAYDTETLVVRGRPSTATAWELEAISGSRLTMTATASFTS